LLEGFSVAIASGVFRLREGYRNRMSGHGFRSVASTILNESGKFNYDAIEKQLAHQEEDLTRAAYHRARYKDDRIEMMHWWADHLDQLTRDADVIRISDSASES
jgi:integrase